MPGILLSKHHRHKRINVVAGFLTSKLSNQNRNLPSQPLCMAHFSETLEPGTASRGPRWSVSNRF
jgi:hypothetical protein